MLLVGLETLLVVILCCHEKYTYEGNSAVSAGRNLRLVGVDENLGVAERTAAAVTADDLGLCPSHVLLVNELDGGHGARLRISS